MTNEQIIRDAISRSISHTEIVHVQVESENLADEIHELVSSATTDEWDYSGVAVTLNRLPIRQFGSLKPCRAICANHPSSHSTSTRKKPRDASIFTPRPMYDRR